MKDLILKLWLGSITPIAVNIENALPDETADVELVIDSIKCAVANVIDNGKALIINDTKIPSKYVKLVQIEDRDGRVLGSVNNEVAV